MSDRKDITISSHNDELSGWLYPAAGAAPGAKSPVIVMAHGLGGTKTMRLDAYCERFSREGYVCVAFDYRYFGGSTGKPRGLVDVGRQIQDWDAVIAFASKLPQVDPARIAIFGTSFSGGHVIRIAATNPLVKAAVSQCPFTDGMASSSTPGLWNVPRMALLSLWDTVFGTDDNPVRIPLVGENGKAAMMNAPDVYNGLHAILPEGTEKLEVEAIPARLILQMPFLYPGTYAKKVQVPILFAICGKDTVAPPGPTLRYAKQAPKGVIKMHPNEGHFDIYVGENFERAVAEYMEFYRESF